MTNQRIFITNLRFWLIFFSQFTLFFFATHYKECLLFVDAQGQRVLEAGLQQPRQRIKSTISGVYSQNATLFFRNSPYYVDAELIVDSEATLTIETGVQIYFATGVGLKVYGTIMAIGNEFAHIQMLPYQEQLNYDETMPEFRLIDGPSVRQGRLQMRFRDRWRSVCTMVTNWTSIDTGAACKSMGYTDGGFWKWYQRNNDTYPLVMPKPDCLTTAKNLWDCDGFKDASKIRLSENLCQGEDDLGLYCWGPPTFTGWARHWKGLQIYSSPFGYVPSDPDMVAAQRESNSRLEFVDIMYAGYDGYSRNVTPALYIEGVPPIMNGLRVERSARDGIHLYEPAGPIILANSTIRDNRGHGLIVENTTDGRFFVNYTLIAGNYGDGIWYRQQFLGDGTQHFGSAGRYKRMSSTSFYDIEQPRLDMCEQHEVLDQLFFPHLIKAHLQNGSTLDALQPIPCWVTIKLPRHLDYVYTIQFLSIADKNPERMNTKTELVICDGNSTFTHLCQLERYRIPIRNGILPQSIPVQSTGNPIYIGLEHSLGPVTNGHVHGDIDLMFRVHASVPHKAFYGLNVTNSLIVNNTGNGIHAIMIRDRFALSNVSVDRNEGLAGVLVKDGAADLWINDTSMSYNWGDGMNVSYAGGAVNLNTSRLTHNQWRGFAFHLNTSLPFYAIQHEIVIKGRPLNNAFYPHMLIADNWWGGVLIGNYCLPESSGFRPRVLINWVQFHNNYYHPHMELFSCQSPKMAETFVDISGNDVRVGSAMGFRMEPAINVHLIMNSNQFQNLDNSAILIRNSKHPQLKHLPAKVEMYRNKMKQNTAPEYVVSIGLNEDAENQRLEFSQLNEIRDNRVLNPFHLLKPRSAPYAALVVSSSSNVLINHNCFANPKSDYEIATSLMEHAKVVDASNNNWNNRDARNFQDRIFDQFNRYSLARITIEPYSSVCNMVMSGRTFLQGIYRDFYPNEQYPIIGGTIYENTDLNGGKYQVVEDLHIMPGAKLTLNPGTVLEFADGVGMLVQGELIRNDRLYESAPIKFTGKTFKLPKVENIRLVDEWGGEDVMSGRLEVRLDGQWGTVCNRSWTAPLAQLACNQLGLTMDPQYFENWRTYVSAGDLSMLMDNIRCEEREYDLTRCRHDGVFHNIQASCRPTEVVGLRCAPPMWAGVRYSLYASPPQTTGQSTMTNWIIEKAGMFDFRSSTFMPALQVDWNYHTFQQLTVRDNYGDGIYIVYNDLTKKPTFKHSIVSGNRLNGVKIGSNGITIENVTIKDNQNAGFRYDPQISAALQRDIVSWLDSTEQPQLEANQVFMMPNKEREIKVTESQFTSRAFLRATINEECPLNGFANCLYEAKLVAEGKSYGMTSKLMIQLVHRPNNESDEDILIVDPHTRRRWSARSHSIDFPITSSDSELTIKYTRSFGQPKLVILVLYLDAQEYLDRFVHVYESVIDNNQYGVSAVHYSNLTFDDGAVLNRWSEEKIWFQKVNFTRNSEAVVWIHSPQHAIVEGTPIAEITWHIDNCSIHDNTGPIIDTHRDLFASANVFHWNFWSNTFENNTQSGVNVLLPDTYDLLAAKTHTFWMTENRFQNNHDFYVRLGGYYTFANISSNNFTDNLARQYQGILELDGMEKRLIMERNRFFNNWGHWMVRVEADSHSLRSGGIDMPSYIQFNYFQFNRFINSIEDYVDMYPRSYTIGAFGSQLIDIHYNRLKNPLMDFEIVAGCTPKVYGFDVMNITYNWFGVANEAEVSQRVFDLDDWNIYTIANFTPYYVSEEQFLNFWWHPPKGQLSFGTPAEPNPLDLKGRMYESKTLKLDPERWYPFPYYYRPFRPYRIVRDLTIMPGATLTIEKNVEVHVAPNVRILVLGNLVADGTLWQPILFKPLNATELLEEEGRVSTRYKRSTFFSRRRKRRVDSSWRQLDFLRLMQKQRQKRASSLVFDPVYKEFPALRRDDPYFQEFKVQLTSNGSRVGTSGFLQLYNATTGEIVPSCDQQFTIRNAQVVCRELGYNTQNVYHWVTPRFDYDPKLHIVKTYMEPRECRGNERRLDKCPLRLAANDSMWMCIDTIFHNYIHCAAPRSLSMAYTDHWGGITFASPSLELKNEPSSDESMLRHVEIVGGGQAHNQSLYSAALQIIRRAPILENVNVTNSSMGGIQIISPRANIVLTRLNISDNSGTGANIISTNLQAASPNSPIPQGPLNIPYNVAGMLDICAAGKTIKVENRMIFYFKYDSRPVDCVKVFKSANSKSLGFRFLHVNLYGATNKLGREDALSIYEDESFSKNSKIGHFTYSSSFSQTMVPTRSTTMAFHWRSTATDGDYGFIAEISTIPSTPDGRNVEEITIRNSRFQNNDRGAVQYRNCGEIGPNFIVEQCLMDSNGYHLYGNISTSAQAMELHLHNTLLFLYRANAMHNNRGGLLITAESSNAGTRLNAVVKNSAFTMNSNSTVLAFVGNDFQKISVLNNVIAKNFAFYFDTVVVQRMSANFTKNLFSSNVGLHTMDTQGHSRISSDAQVFVENFFVDNIALGHGNQYLESFGYVPLVENDEFHRRPKRQVLTQKSISFDWWTHVGVETGRYRSTIVAGSSHQKFLRNVFANPLNTFELTTSQETPYDSGEIDGRQNYWGYPGTSGVAAGKIRDQADYPYLIRVNYEPILESNSSLIEGDCPPGWFQVGHEEFKSCFLFVGASMTYSGAVRFCEELDSFMPILRADDSRQKELAARVDDFGLKYITEIERYNSFGLSYDIPIWISSVTLPSNQCGWMSSRTGSIGEQNCNNLLPFVCEKGTKPYQEPVLWRRDIIIVVLILLLLLFIIAILIVCACRNSHRDDKLFYKRKQFFRESLVRKSRQNGRELPSTAGVANHDIFDAMNPRASVTNLAANLPPRQSRRSGKKTSSSTNSDSCSTCPSTYQTPSCTSAPTYSTLPTSTAGATDQTPPPAYVPPGKDGKQFMDKRNQHVSLNPNPYDSANSTFRSAPTTQTFPSSTQTTSTTYESMSASFMSTTSCSTCVCSSRQTTIYCAVCAGADSTTDRTRDSDAPTLSMDSFEDESQSVSSDSTVTAVEKPLLKTSALGNTPMSASRRSLSSASTAATILQVSQRTDETPGRHADFLRGSERLASTSARSNPNLYQEDIPMDSAATLSRRESARSSSMLPPPPPYVHDSRGKSEERRPQPTSLSQIIQRGTIPVAQTALKPLQKPPPKPTGYVNITPSVGTRRTPPVLPTNGTNGRQQQPASSTRRPGRLPNIEDDRYIPLETSM